jgi:redox-sensitive bicupin YhaK (pirin superfamily)
MSSAARQSIGPFVFLDLFGPLTVAPAAAVDVRSHPHIGFATVTYVFEDAIAHRDGLRTVQRIESGAVNWMSAGRGIKQTERRPGDLREHLSNVHGLQLWAPLPQSLDESPPSGVHTPANQLPRGGPEIASSFFCTRFSHQRDYSRGQLCKVSVDAAQTYFRHRRRNDLPALPPDRLARFQALDEQQHRPLHGFRRTRLAASEAVPLC